MTILARLADQVLNRPLLITPDKAQVILSVLSGRLGVDTPEANRFEGTPFATDEAGKVRMRPYNVSNGVAVITITGSLVNRGAWVGASSGLTSYEGIQFQLKSAAADPAVRAVILDMHTPGGQAVGAFETAALVRQLAAKKPTIALVAGMAASAGYAIASGATQIVTTESGVSGSIGVVLLHADFSRQLANEGVTPTLIFAGGHKVDGNPFEPLSKDVREDLQAEVNSLYELFLKTVAAGRGARLDVEAARRTEARVQMGQAAVSAGLADRVGSFEDVLAELSRASGRIPSSNPKGRKMDETTGAPAAEAGISKADLDKAVAEAVAKGLAEGRQAEATRLAGIEANAVPGCEALIAKHKADPAMTPEKSAQEVLAAIRARPADAAAGLAALNNATAGVTATPSAMGGGAAPQPVAETPDGWKAEWTGSKDLRAEFGSADDYAAFKQAEANGQVRILKSKAA